MYDRVTDKEFAEFLRLGVEGLWVTVPEVRRWADRCIESSESVPDWAIDLSIVDDRNEALSLLLAVPGDSDTERPVRLLVGFLKRKWSSERVPARVVARGLDAIRRHLTLESDLAIELMVPEVMYNTAEHTGEGLGWDGKSSTPEQIDEIVMAAHAEADESVRSCLAKFVADEAIVFDTHLKDDD